MRVRQRNEYGDATSLHQLHVTGSSDDAHVSLFEEYVFLNKGDKSFIGEVFRMVHGGQEFRRPVGFSDSRGPNITLHVRKYIVAGHGHFTVGSDITKVNFGDILCRINLTDKGDGTLVIDTNELAYIEQQVSEIFHQNRPTKKRQRQTRSEDDGRRTVRVIAEEPTISGLRRSQRSRTMIIHECE